MRFPILVVALLLGAVAHADSLDEIVRLDREKSVATWTGDTVWFEENLTDDYVLVTPDGQTRSKRDVIRGLVRPGLRMEPYENGEVHVRIYGDAVVVTGRMQQSFSLGRTRYRNDLRYTDLYIKRKGRWYLASAHTSAVK